MNIKKTLPLILLSFFLATFVWFLAKQGSETIQMHFFPQLVFRNLPSNMQITSEIQPTINVSGRITQRHSNSFNPAGVQAVIDLTGAQAGVLRRTLTRQNITVPEIMAIDTINPSQIELIIEEIVEKNLTIRPRYQGRLKERHVLKNIEIEPSTVTIKGPKSVLETIHSIFTTEIDLQDLNQPAEVLVQLDLPNQKLQFLDDVETYTAHILVESLPIRKLFDAVPVHLLHQTHETQINPATFNLYLEGPEDLLKSLDSSQLYGTIDLANLKPGSHWVHPPAVIPEGITVLKKWPRISVWVKQQKLITPERKGVATPQPSIVPSDSTPSTSAKQ